jgi:hypothetical protein
MRISLFFLLVNIVYGASVVTHGYDNARTKATLAETKITQANVAKLVSLGSFSVDGAVYAQPLVAEGIGGKNLLIVATMNDSLYAFDTAKPGSGPVWKTTVASALTFGGTGSSWPNGQIGCQATPVIDISAAVVYASCADLNNDWRIYALNLADGSQFHAPTLIAGTSAGVTFNSTHQQNSRAGLLLLSGIVYVAFASYDDLAPFNGWIFGYDSTTLAKTYTYCDTCASGANGGAGIWWSPASDGTYIYAATGNGDWNGTTNFGESLIKLTADLSTVSSYLTPANWATLNSGDQDLGAGRAILAEGGTLAIVEGKNAHVWVGSTAALGGLEGRDAGPLQTFTSPEPAWHDDQAYGNHTLFLPGRFFLGYLWNGSSFNTSSFISAAFGTEYGGSMSYSSNNDTAGTQILWVTTVGSGAFGNLRAGTLHALSATSMGELWNSGSTLGNLAKFGVPTVVSNGQVYVPTFSNKVQIYGFPASSGMSGTATMTGSAALQ